jgi:hypothetical protein
VRGHLIAVVAAERRPEVAQAAAERPADFGEPLRAEHQQRDNKDEKQVRWLEDVADHTESLAGGDRRHEAFGFS